MSTQATLDLITHESPPPTPLKVKGGPYKKFIGSQGFADELLDHARSAAREVANKRMQKCDLWIKQAEEDARIGRFNFWSSRLGDLKRERAAWEHGWQIAEQTLINEINKVKSIHYPEKKEHDLEDTYGTDIL